MPFRSHHHESFLLDIERLHVLRDLALLDDTFENVYDKLTTLAGEVIGTPVSLVSMVAGDYQFFKSHKGLPEPWKSKRRTPLSHSFCQHVVTRKEPLIVEDARDVDFLKDNLAIPDLNVIGYLGIPLTLSNSTSLGSFCVIDGKPRKWKEVEINIMQELAAILIHEFETRANINLDKATFDDLHHIQQNIDTLINTIDASATQSQILKQIQSLRQELKLV